MSHTTTLKSVAIRDVSAMRAAVTALKERGVDCDLVENARPRMYYADQGEVCEYVLKLDKGPYDVGFKKQADGTYAPVFDEWRSNVGNQIGADVNAYPIPEDADGRALHQIGQFMQEYTKAATISAAVQQGYSVESANMDAEGNCHLVLGGM